MRNLKETIYIRFAEHISDTHIKGIIYEIEGMSGIVEQKGDDVYRITRHKNIEYISDFILNEERIGTLIRLQNSDEVKTSTE